MYQKMWFVETAGGEQTSSQVKSAPTPAGEPNVMAEAEKRKKYVHQKMPNPVQPTSISQRTSKK